jgi:heat shock protein HslJ
MTFKSSSICFACFAAFLAVFAVPARARATHDTAQHGALPAAIENREWYIAQYFTHKETEIGMPDGRVVPERLPYIAFKGGTIEGSPGCGWFTGTYGKLSDRLTLSAVWSESKGTPCNDEDKKAAAKILSDFTRVRQIKVEPDYWHSDALLLADAAGETMITLGPKRSGNDLSELHDTFWHVSRLAGSAADFDGAVIEIEQRGVRFSTPSYFREFPFEYKLAGLEFFPAWARGEDSSSNRFTQDRQIASSFEKAMRRISSYSSSNGNLTFWSKEKLPILTLAPVHQMGIENRRWRISKYLVEGGAKGDGDGLIDAKKPAEITFLNGRVDGSPGCGAWVGAYQLSGNELKYDAAFMLAGTCFRDEEEQGKLVVKSFAKEMLIEEGEGHILLRDTNGRVRVLLEPYRGLSLGDGAELERAGRESRE